MRLKSKVVMIILLSALLLINFLGLSAYSKRDKKEEEVIDVVPTDERVVPDTFKGTVKDEFGVPEGVMKVITDYMDAYYLSTFELEKVDMKDLFSNELMAKISDRAISLLVDVRKMHDFDFRMDKAHYDLKVTDYSESNGEYHVDILEDDYMSFSFLNGIESSAYDIENYFVIINVDGTYKIKDLEKVRGYYMNFYDCESAEEADDTYDYFIEQLRDMLDYNEVLKRKAGEKPYLSKKYAANPYDRAKAVAYIDQYYHSRNPEWYNFTDEGGNCQNYASQAMLAGGIPMDYTGEDQWKCYVLDPEYDPYINDDETAEGRTRSWVNVGYFYNYAKYNEGYGLSAETDVNLYYGEPGDIIIVGNNELSHTVMISKVVDGHILVDSNSIDMKDYPVEAYTYTNINLIKISGYN